MTRILLVGCGKMGGALLAGWLEQGLPPSDIVIVDPNVSEFPASVRQVADYRQLPADFSPEIVLLAVKPQAIDAILPDYATYRDALFVSIAAGRTLSSLERHLGQDAAIIRAMPNTPSAVRRGVTVLLANAKATETQRARCERLMAAVGEVAWIEDEAHMNAVTALSGSGPAYVFLLVEALAHAGEDLGLARELSVMLARATVVGAGELLRQSPQSAGQLRENVTSPNGTTFAALQVLGEPGGLTNLLQRALAAAARRAQELSA